MSSAGAIHGHNGDANEHLEGDDSDATALPRSSPGLTVSFKDIGIQVHGLGEDYGSTCLSVLGDLIFPSGKSAKTTRHILHGVFGQVRPGEMMLVLGRPGSGCTSLLKIISNMRKEFHKVDGEIRYGNVGHKQAHHFRNKIVMNTEDDRHFPTLKVSETLEFAAYTKVPKTKPGPSSTNKDYINSTTDHILSSLGIGHTKNTIVGNEFVRGVSGGERKRVSLAEVMATQAIVQCWDNSTRGLDASNALDFAKLLRKTADEENKSIVATLYQAGNSIFNLFDKVLVLAEGREIYYGPTSHAKQYFEDLGFRCPTGANIADFLTSVTSPAERALFPGYDDTAPNTVEDFEAAYKQSAVFRDMMCEMTSADESTLAAEVETLGALRELEKKRSFPLLSRETSPYFVSFGRQIWVCTTRQLRRMWGDRLTNILTVSSGIIIALENGSMMYNLGDTSSSLFPRSSALYFPLLYLGLNAMSETTASFSGRPIISRQKRLAFARPAAHSIASMLADIPPTIIHLSLFEIIFYFMVSFEQDAGYFFTQWFIYLVHALCLLSFFRMVGTWCKHFGLASQITGWCIMVMMVYSGYLIPIPQMHPWFRWISYLDPTTYAFSAAMGSEVGSRTLQCVEPDYVPYGTSYNDTSYRSCILAGSSPGDPTLSGEEYLRAEYGDSTQHVWRNIGIIIAFWIFFAILAALGAEFTLDIDTGSKILFDKRSETHYQARGIQDVEKSTPGSTTAASHESDTEGGENTESTVFTFKDISYYVHHAGAEKQLLEKVSGYVKPGSLVALMGSSGAGKTTLMDVLAQRKDTGRIEGSILVNGKPQDISFQRTTGYCEQNDIHEPTATVREALLFAARLRQSYDTPDEDKVSYVEYIMDLLELNSLQHALIGVLDSGLSIEQRKRLTIATELVAKPTLLFLDEPTSGLDGQSAFEICRFMRKLAARGQTIICTIHQPSAVLFEAFDVLLLLARGGRTTYFGPTGKDSSIVLQYFAEKGAPCPQDANPAEHIVDVVQGRFGTNIDWPEEWLNSEQRKQEMTELEQLESSQKAGSPETPDAHPEKLHSFATPVSYQILLVTKRQLLCLWRNPDYIWNKIGLHISNSLFGGFTFWMIGNGSFELQLHLMAVFNFVFVAPGCINQMQPLFIANRDLFETREKKSKTYHWLAFITAQLLSEIPALILCGTLYFVCWYFTCGFPVRAADSGQVYLEMLFYEFLYTSIGQSIAAYSPNAIFAALANPLIVGTLIAFCGVVIPYNEITAFWRYWLYWINPFTYLIGALLTPVTWDVDVQCKESELTTIPLPYNTTCGRYMEEYLADAAGYILDESSSTSCKYCEYSTGADYMKTMNINERYYGWRDVGITVIFCLSSYALVFLMMKLRTKATKTAS